MEVEREKTDKISTSLNVKPPVMSPDKELSKEKECSFQSENHREVPEVPRLVCTTVNTAPMIDCKILNVNKSGCIDTAAVITVIPRTRDLPVAKLKRVTSHKPNLYGPAMTEFEIGGKVFKHNTYEADIHENILGIDFLHKFDAVIGIKKQVLEIGEGLDRVHVPFTLGETKTARIYTTDRVAYTLRAEGSFKLRPFVEREIQTKLVTDAVTDEPMGEGIGAFESSGNTQGLDLGGQGHTQSRVVLETQVADQAVLSGSKGTSEKGSLNKRGHLPGETKLGLFISNPAFGNRVSRLPLGVIAQSGVIPCLTEPISITMQNLRDKCVTIPKYAVLGEVFILHPDKYEQEFSTNSQEEEEVDEGISEGMDTDETVQVNVINHDTTPFSDAEINTIPNLPAIGENEPLPKDLQDLVERGSPLQNEEMHKMYPFWVRKTMQDIHEVVAHMNKKAAKRMKAYYDRNATLSPFLEGDLVYLYYPRRVKGISAKLITRWEGPYRIINLINDCNARTERVDNPSKRLIVHIDRLARCPAPDTTVNKQDDPFEDQAGKEESAANDCPSRAEPATQPSPAPPSQPNPTGPAQRVGNRGVGRTSSAGGRQESGGVPAGSGGVSNPELPSPPLIKLPGPQRLSETLLPSSLIKDLELSDSDSENETIEVNESKYVSELSEEIEMLEVEINKVDVSSELEKEISEIDKRMELEIEAIKEIESRLEYVKIQKLPTSTCDNKYGGMNLKMKWKLCPVSDIQLASGRREWINELYKSREQEKGNFRFHPDDPKQKLRCRKCRQRFHSAGQCPNVKRVK
ncbi:Ubiquitin-like protein ATG12 [Frankliniella fusca]|uniref:Ubiquitin-like protein ATG12 n=1 Tax=Frankliniella fusca TaxID=407009 RepID=A0AAE1HNI7_9NEOP|nr:Ubiquitin-like protein ATG12 [Frankliniella fusca]